MEQAILGSLLQVRRSCPLRTPHDTIARRQATAINLVFFAKTASPDGGDLKPESLTSKENDLIAYLQSTYLDCIALGETNEQVIEMTKARFLANLCLETAS